jgi:hypothetical protein
VVEPEARAREFPRELDERVKIHPGDVSGFAPDRERPVRRRAHERWRPVRARPVDVARTNAEDSLREKYESTSTARAPIVAAIVAIAPVASARERVALRARARARGGVGRIALCGDLDASKSSLRREPSRGCRRASRPRRARRRARRRPRGRRARRRRPRARATRAAARARRAAVA